MRELSIGLPKAVDVPRAGRGEELRSNSEAGESNREICRLDVPRRTRRDARTRGGTS
jgi:hypothetical protein